MTWDELDHETQEDLIEWYNVREEDLEPEDYARLAKLYSDGKFTAFDCDGGCGERVLNGRPDDWGHFQGVNDCEYMGTLCADCYGTYERLKGFAG